MSRFFVSPCKTKGFHLSKKRWNPYKFQKTKKLYIKSKMHDIAILNYIFLPFDANFTSFTTGRL